MKDSAMAGIWWQAPNHSIFRTIFEQNMDDSSFTSNEIALEKAINLPNEAFFGYASTVKQKQETACKVLISISETVSFDIIIEAKDKLCGNQP